MHDEDGKEPRQKSQNDWAKILGEYLSFRIWDNLIMASLETNM